MKNGMKKASKWLTESWKHVLEHESSVQRGIVEKRFRPDEVMRSELKIALKRLNLDQNDAKLAGGRRTDEQLPLTHQANGPHFYLRHNSLHLDHDYNGCRHR